MEGADDGNVQVGELFQQGLHLLPILAHDADVVPAGFAGPVLLHVQGAELAEAVGGEEDLIIGIIGDDNLRPVDHGGGDKGQGVLAQLQGVPLPHHDPAVRVVLAEEVFHHGKGLGRGNHHSLRIGFQEVGNVGGVVRFHVLHHQVVGLAAGQDTLDVFHPLLGEVLVHRVHNGDLLVQDGIGIVGHAVGNGILPLKQVNLMVAHADILDVFRNDHRAFSFS